MLLLSTPTRYLMADTTDLDRVVRVERETLVPLGFTRQETGMTGRLFYRRSPGTAPAPAVAVHLHVVPSASWPTQNERLLRDHLLGHPDDVVRYADLKRQLASQIADPLVYTRAKTALIQELVDHARTERGLPSVIVWVD